MPAYDGGLTSEEAKKLLVQFGPNALPEKPPPGDFQIFVSQLKSPLVYILLAASFITFFLGKFGDTSIILLAVLINTVLGFWQERRAGKALSALKKLISPIAVVIRDGAQKQIPLSEVVPGDVAVLNQGIRVPGDGEIIEAKTLFINEAILTGESQASEKSSNDKAFLGTMVVSGRGLMVVGTTGQETQMGKIAKEVGGPSEQTPLQRQLRKLAQKLAVLVGVLTVGVFGIGIAIGESVSEMFLTSVALAVSAVPEGLLVSTTVVLALGMTRILKRKGLVRRLLAAETLGGVTVICTDKTGTLTKGEMEVINVLGDQESLFLCAVLCNDLHDPLEVGMYEWAKKQKDADERLEKVAKEYVRVDELPFSTRHRYAAFLYRRKKEVSVFLSGAPEIVIDYCRLSPREKDEWRRKIDDFSRQGLRIVGFAKRPVLRGENKLSRSTVASKFFFVGLVLFADPVREGIKVALDETERAGIKVKVITGDHPGTAVAVLEQLGRRPTRDEVMLGREMETMSDEELFKRIPKITLFARTTPEQKLRIVELLKKHGEIVAMTGDGVNDAPALARADIGIVVGDAADVARESADLVLLDSNFETIIAAIEEGRGIFDNLRKIVVYLLSDAFSEITTVVGALLLAFPLPLTAIQILWINLVSDGLPNLALTVDPKSRGIMREQPRFSKEQILTRKITLLLLFTSIASGFLALIVFIVFWRGSGDIALARSVAFLTLGVNSLLYVFSLRNLGEFVWNDWFSNRWLLGAVVIGFVLQALPFYIPVLREFFGVVPLAFLHWAVALGAGMVVVIFVEASKMLFVRK